jgi:hypothetical protein
VSLTSRLRDNPAVKELFRQRVRSPGPLYQPPLRVAPSSGSPQVVGTAFDYALRAGLSARRWGRWGSAVAARGVHLAERHPLLSGLAMLAREQLEEALTLLRSLDDGEQLPAEGARACLLLAGLDVLWRSPRHAEPALRRVIELEEIDELQRLYRIVPWEELRPARALWLNPEFGEGSRRIGGADADLIVDGLLIDIKTVRSTRITPAYVRQLVGYALLANRFGVTSGARAAQEPINIARAGVYFSRAGRLITFNLRDCVDEGDHPTLLAALLGTSSS